MWIKRTRGWELPERAATPEEVFFNRRKFLGSAGAAIALSSASGLAPAQAATPEDDPTADLYPVSRNDKYKIVRQLTPEQTASTYNNFYEFGSHKKIWRAAQKLEVRPWSVTFDGMVEDEKTVDIDTLIRQMPLEERLYRHRCVEAWSMVVPWSGFAMAELVKFAKPLSGAKYVRMETFLNSKVAPGQRAPWYPWPYVEGLTIEEATNELAFMVTGVYGKPMAEQFGAPLRLAVPWKYGFKSIKSIVKFTFTDKRPVSFWEEVQGSEYGFWANVNPDVPHARWSQASERDLGTDERVPTQFLNGYAEYVADLYKDLQDEPLYI